MLMSCQRRSGTTEAALPDSFLAPVIPQETTVIPLPSGSLPIEINDVTRIALSPDNRYLAWYELSDVPNPHGPLKHRQQHDIRVWSIPERKQIARQSIDDQATALCFSPDGRLLAVAYFSGAVQLWDTENWKRQAVLGILGQKEDNVFGMAFSQDGRSLAVGDEDTRVRVWNLSTRQARLFGKFTYIPVRVSFSPEGHYLAVADSDGDIKIWDVPTGEEHWSFEAHTHPITGRVGIQGLAFHPDGRKLVTAGTDGMVRVWDVLNKKETRHFEGKVGEINAMSLSPNGAMVAIAGGHWNVDKAGGVRIWDVITGRQLAERGPLDHGVSCLCFSHDSKGLVVGTYGRPKGTILLWTVADLLEKNDGESKP
jgi:WD40 repeat protein